MSTPGALDLGRWQRASSSAGVVALGLCLIGGIFGQEDQFFRAYLAAYQWPLGIALGSMVLVMIYHLTGGAWGYLVRHILEASMRTLPFLVILFVPVALGMYWLYPWTTTADAALQHKEIYLNVTFFLIRTAIFFAAWLVMALLLSRWSEQQDAGDDPTLPRKLRRLSAPGLVVYGLTITFAGIDWIMSLQPHWYSTIFSVLFAVGQILTGMAFAIVILVLLRDRPALAQVVSPDTLNDLGNLLFTFIILWTYMSFSQFMLIWVSNLREEIVWYLPRTRHGWQWVAWAIALFHFFIPFLLLLSRDFKRNPVALAGVAAGILFMQLVQLFWQVLPAFPNTPIYEHWMDLLAPVGVGGLWLSFFLWQLERRPLLPRYDPSRLEAARLREIDEEEAARREELTGNG
jgi:hypothetical protein